MPKYNRQSIRLVGYDYTQSGYYFITICTQERIERFDEIVGGKMNLNVFGQCAYNCWNEISNHFPNIKLDYFVVMPNHIHGIICINRDDMVVGRDTACRAPANKNNYSKKIEKFGKPVSGSIPTIVRSYKSVVTKQIRQMPNMKGVKLWQRNYWEHVVRNEIELNCIREYIEHNPKKWENDKLNSANFSPTKSCQISCSS